MDVSAQAGTDSVPEGQPPEVSPAVELEGNNGQPIEDVKEGKEPKSGVEGLPEDWTPDTISDRFKDYQNLQREFGSRNEELKEFKAISEQMAAYGGPEQMMAWMQYLSSNPSFAEWVQSQQNQEQKQDLGFNTEDMDEDTQKALEIVEKIAGNKAAALIEEAIRSKVDPITNTYKEQVLENNLDIMDETYGEDWREMQDVMADLAAGLPKDVQDSPSFEDIEDLYWRALRKSGKMDDYAAKAYEKKLSSKKAHATEKPSSANSKGAPKKAMSIAEAFELAKQQIT